MQLSTLASLEQLQILLNLAKFLNESGRAESTAWLRASLYANGYTPSDEVFHKAILILEEDHLRVRIRFSFVDDQTRFDAARVLGSWYVVAVRGASLGWNLMGDY
jgi:hypothetical protein